MLREAGLAGLGLMAGAFCGSAACEAISLPALFAYFSVIFCEGGELS